MNRHPVKRLLPASPGQDDEDLQPLRRLLAERIAEAQHGEMVEGSVLALVDDLLRQEAPVS